LLTVTRNGVKGSWETSGVHKEIEKPGSLLNRTRFSSLLNGFTEGNAFNLVRHLLAEKKISETIPLNFNFITLISLFVFVSTHFWLPDPVVTPANSTCQVILRSQSVGSNFYF
jgi:hypothetical protein